MPWNRSYILKKIYPIDVERHTYERGIDTMTAYQAGRDGCNVVVDDRCIIYHPESIHEIDKEAAYREFMSYFDDTELKAFIEAVGPLNPDIEIIGLKSDLQLVHFATSRLKLENLTVSRMLRRFPDHRD